MLRWKPLLFFIIIPLSLALGGGLLWAFQLDQQIQEKLHSRRFGTPTGFYSAPEILRPGLKLGADDVVQRLRQLNYQQREADQTIHSREYTIWKIDQCVQRITNWTLPDEIGRAHV